jgi:protein tyrosine phosphatase
MTTKAIERHRTKCGQYWPEDVGASLVAGNFRVTSEEVENCGDDFLVTHLRLEQIDSGQVRPVCHFQVPILFIHFDQKKFHSMHNLLLTQFDRKTGHRM